MAPITLTALGLAAAIAGAIGADAPGPVPAPVPAPTLVRVAAPAAELLAAAQPGAPVTGHVFRDQVVSAGAQVDGRVLVTRADGISGWLDPATTRPARTCTPLSVGLPYRGRLRCGWTLAAESDTWATWDFPLGTSPNRRERRYGTDTLIQMVERVAGAFHLAHPERRLLIGDLSRPHGGPFGRRFGGVGHASHQNGRDVDVYFPRTDALELPPARPADVDLALAREVVLRFARERTQLLLVGCARDYLLSGVRKVRRFCNRYHENHVHVRLR